MSFSLSLGIWALLFHLQGLDFYIKVLEIGFIHSAFLHLAFCEANVRVVLKWIILCRQNRDEVE